MAIFHSHVQIISRGKGKSAVAAAAYRAGEAIKNEYDGVLHDFTRKKGIVHRSILLPNHAPKAYNDRGVLWNAVEKIEKAENAQMARELEIALPIEFTREQNISLACEYVQRTFVSAGMCADLCVHDVDGSNPHMHIMLTVRPIMPDGKWGGKQKKEYILDDNGDKIYNPQKRQYKCRSIPSTDWNKHAKADEWRKAWEDMANAELERHGFDSRIDRRSYEEQGIEQIPSVHLGAAAHQMEKRGIRTERGDINRKIEITNKEIRQLRARINKLDKWIAEESANDKPPTLADVIQDIMSRQGQSSLTRLKKGTEIFNFLMENEIYDMADLEQKTKAMRGKVNTLHADLKKVERRVNTLEEHLRHSGSIKAYRKHKTKYEDLYSQYTAIKKAKGFMWERKAQKALDAANDYHEIYRIEITSFEKSDSYMRDILQDRYDPKKLPPITKWQEEFAAKSSEKDALYQEYHTLRSETEKVEQIKRSVAEILHSASPKRTPQKSRGMVI